MTSVVSVIRAQLLQSSGILVLDLHAALVCTVYYIMNTILSRLATLSSIMLYAQYLTIDLCLTIAKES